MTIEEAIKLLEIEDLRSYPKRRLEAHLAIKLGVEALRRIYIQYDPDHQIMRTPLPGETK